MALHTAISQCANNTQLTNTTYIYDHIMEKVNKCFDELKDTEIFSNSSQSQIFEQEFHRKKERINAK